MENPTTFLSLLVRDLPRGQAEQAFEEGVAGMNTDYLVSQFGLEGKVAFVTGGGGGLFSEVSKGLARAGAKVVVAALSDKRSRGVAEQIRAEGGVATVCKVDVLDKAAVREALGATLEQFGKVDILINGAGGNRPEASTSATLPFFDLSEEALRWVFDLNLLGTVIPCQVFGQQMAEQKEGVILNVASMAALRPLTSIVAYSAAKAAVVNFTQWLATYMSQNCSPHIRVNALMPGFFLGRQNRYLLIDENTGAWTERAKQILAHTPMGRLGSAESDLVGAALWLVSPASRFVHGAVIPVDGGFSAYSGV